MKPKCLGICLFYNDEDIVDEAIQHLLRNNHDVIVWNHGSNDNTQGVIDRYKNHILAQHFLPRSFDFYKLFEHVSKYIIETYVKQYDWISFPESDEFLEGPLRDKSYYEYVRDVFESPYDWIQFNNLVFWFTEKDDSNISMVRERIKHYSFWGDCGPRVYAWKAAAMNVREFNHNPANGMRYPLLFNTCHYQVRSREHLIKRIESRVGLSKGAANYHFDYMKNNISKLYIDSNQLNFDNGGNLSLEQVFDWSKYVYGSYEELIKQLEQSGNPPL